MSQKLIQQPCYGSHIFTTVAAHTLPRGRKLHSSDATLRGGLLAIALAGTN